LTFDNRRIMPLRSIILGRSSAIAEKPPTAYVLNAIKLANFHAVNVSLYRTLFI